MYLLYLTAYCKMQTGLSKIAHNAFQYPFHLFWNHFTHLVRITGIACAFEPHLACYGMLKKSENQLLKSAIFDTIVS